MLLLLILLYMEIASVHNGFSVDGVYALADALLVNRHLTHLNLGKALCMALIVPNHPSSFVLVIE
jgi:hypothetical protein